MKRKNLYIKNEKGRYEEFRPDMKSEDSDLLFRKKRQVRSSKQEIRI